VTSNDQISDSVSEEETMILARLIYKYIEINENVTRYGIGMHCAGRDSKSLTAAINLLLNEGAIQYSPNGIKLGPNQFILQPCISNDDGDLAQEADGYLIKIRRIERKVEKYIRSSGIYAPTDEIESVIRALPDSIEKDVLTEYFIEPGDISDYNLDEKQYNCIIKTFSDSFQCNEDDVELFTNYFIPSNTFIYVFNKSFSYYRMMCLKYEPGNLSPEQLMDPEVDTKVRILPYGRVSLFDRIKQFTKGYIDSCDGEKYDSFVECYLFLNNEYAVEIGSLNYAAYRMHGVDSGKSSASVENDDSILDDFIITSRSVKYLSSNNIVDVLEYLRDTYNKRAITPEKIFKDNLEFFFHHFIEDISELKQIITKYTSLDITEGYLCFNTTLSTAITDFIKESELFDIPKISKSFTRKNGGCLSVIVDYANTIELKTEGTDAKTISDEQYRLLTNEFEDYSWITAENANDIFKYKLNCEELFNSYNMHKLGFILDGDVYYRTDYGSFKECLKKTMFSGEDYFVEKSFIVFLSCNSFKKEVEYLISKSMWIPVAENRYVNLRRKKYAPLYDAIKQCIPLLEEMCRNDFMTAHKLKKNGTGVEYIDNNDFEMIFYDSLLKSTRANRTTIRKQRVYHFASGDHFGSPALMRHIVRSEGGGTDILKIKTILEKEYGIIAFESDIRQMINRSGCIFLKETDTVYENKKSYMEVNKNESYR